VVKQYDIVHATGYTYDTVVHQSYNEARMTPQTSTGQLVVTSRLDVTPTPWTMRYRDYWGSMVTAFEVHEPHHELTLEAHSTVRVDRRPPRARNLGWDDLREPRLVDRLCEYLEVPARVAPAGDFAEMVEDLLDSGRTPAEFAVDVCRVVHDEMEYVVGSTEVQTSAADAWAARAGVCQDFAHLCIGALRIAGIPARYVSGYLHPATEPEVGETVVGESHAWVDWWDGTWVGFDPTNATVPDDRYVVVGTGRDYADVAPLAGIFAGGETSSLFVQVSLTRTE
jgi:transglutaminase-like putative cysteine protease